MSEAARQRVLPLLQAMPTAGLAAAKQLFCTELNYDRANERLSTRGWAAPVQATLAGREPPLLLAQHRSQFGDFHIIYTRLAAEQRGRAFPLSLAAERQVVAQLLPDHPYALFLFSDPEAHHWHLVNVRYDQEAARRRIYRRIAVGPHERLRTAAERVAMLDVAALPRDLLGLAPIAIQQRHDEAFDVEAVTRSFFGEYRAIFQTTEERIKGLRGDSRRLFTQKLFNRLMFIVFLERKGWLTFQGQGDYLRALWEDYQQERQRTPDISFYRDRLRLLFFSGLNTPNEVNIVGIRRDGVLQTRIGDVPYLNGGLFEEDDTDRDSRIVVPDEVLERALERLFYHFNFTVTESTPLDIEVAVDPEMLGKIFEELVTGRHETGSYYTPKPVVAFMGREALKGHLLANCPQESPAAIAAFVDERDPAALRNPETVLEALRTVKVCDLACGSGAYLLGMLHEFLDLRAGLFATRGLDALTTYQRKLEIIQHNLYGVDLDPFAVNIARLRLWLSLIVDFDGDNPPPLPNLDFKIEAGDSLTGPDPSGGIQPDLFRQRQVEEFFRVKADFLLAHGGEKVELRKQIERLRQEIAAWAHPKGGGGGFDWAVEFAEVFTPAAGSGRKGGFDIVLANPPYVRADAQYKHIEDEEDRQKAIARWQGYREALKKGPAYQTLYEKWDLYIPFLERAWQLLRPAGQMVFIIPDAYNAAKYARKSHEFFLAQARVARVDFCSEIPLFAAGVSNTIVHYARERPAEGHAPGRFRRWGEGPDDFEANVAALPAAPQATFGVTLFRPDGRGPAESSGEFVSLERICYISVGMVIHADERRAHLAFKAEELISPERDETHTKSFVEGKDLAKWWPQRIRFLEYGTPRAPSLFRRPTFPQLHEAKERLLALRMCGEAPAVTYDDRGIFSNHTVIVFVPWHHLNGVVNNSIGKTAKYRRQDPAGDREERERTSRQFHVKYVLAIMNSSFARDWLSRQRRSKTDIYPDDWKPLPIAPLPLEAQAEFVRLVDAILAEYARHGYPLPEEAARRVGEIEQEIDRRVGEAYQGV